MTCMSVQSSLSTRTFQTSSLFVAPLCCCSNRLTGYGIHHCFARSMMDPEARPTALCHADYYTMAGIAVATCLALCPAVGLMGRRGGLLTFMIITALASLLQLGLLNRELSHEWLYLGYHQAEIKRKCWLENIPIWNWSRLESRPYFYQNFTKLEPRLFIMRKKQIIFTHIHKFRLSFTFSLPCCFLSFYAFSFNFSIPIWYLFLSALVCKGRRLKWESCLYLIANFLDGSLKVVCLLPPREKKSELGHYLRIQPAWKPSNCIL